MSDDIAIKVEGLGKCYHIYDTPRDRLKQFVLPRLQRMVGAQPKQYFREFWALRDVSFEVKKGETVGIIGRNGSGKSTLLQIICGTLNPTCGKVTTNGRVAALLELGAGFNPEFTGRENVYMAAQLLGLTKAQVEDRFDRIAAFADIGDFIERPVKNYSSGMYVRLAFAVNAHVDADILVIDEALAVGDAVFTQKCMRFIRSFREQGTLLFVSHDTGAVQNLCSHAIWLSGGEVRAMGATREVCERYLQFTLQEIYGNEVQLRDVRQESVASVEPKTPVEPESDSISAPATYTGSYLVAEGVIEPRARLEQARGFTTGCARIESVSLVHADGHPVVTLGGNEPVRLRIQARAEQSLAQPILGFLVRDRLGQDLFGENTLPYTSQHPLSVEAGQTFEAEFSFRLPMLPNGEYAVMCSVADGTLHNHVQHHWLHDALILRVSSAKVRYGLVGIPFENVVLKVRG